jgi:hypothetical protein
MNSYGGGLVIIIVYAGGSAPDTGLAILTQDFKEILLQDSSSYLIQQT